MRLPTRTFRWTTTIAKIARVRDAFEERTSMPGTILRVSRVVHDALREEFATAPLIDRGILDGENVTVLGMRYMVDPTFDENTEAIVVEGDHPFDDSEGARHWRLVFEKLGPYMSTSSDITDD